LTHAGRIDLHLAGALGVFALAPVVTARLRRGDDPVAAPAARTLLVLLGLQLLLGAGAFVGRFSSLALPGGAVTGLALPVAHRLTGSLILGAAVVLALRVSRNMGGPDMAPQPPQRSEHPGEAVALLETLRPAPSSGAPRLVVVSRGTP
jgi:heme A synthase